MDLDKEQSKLVLDLLIKSGRVTEDQVAELMTAKPLTKGIAEAVDLVHLMSCSANHGDDDDNPVPTGCKYYREDSSEDPWEGPFHKLWTRKTAEIMGELHLDTDEKILTFLRRAIELVGSIMQMKLDYPECPRILKGFIGRQL